MDSYNLSPINYSSGNNHKKTLIIGGVSAIIFFVIIIIIIFATRKSCPIYAEEAVLPRRLSTTTAYRPFFTRRASTTSAERPVFTRLASTTSAEEEVTRQSTTNATENNDSDLEESDEVSGLYSATNQTYEEITEFTQSDDINT